MSGEKALDFFKKVRKLTIYASKALILFFMKKAITDQWVISSMVDRVHINYTEEVEAIPPFREFPQKIVDRIIPMPKALPQPKENGSTVDAILEIMLSNQVRRGKKILIEPCLEELKEKVAVLVKNTQPISFILPSLPFKDQSPFVTQASIDHVDLCEYAFFAQIKRIISAIQHVYEPGAHFTVLCDGYVFAPIFANGDAEGAGRYKARCQQIKNELGMYNTVTLFDMREIFFDMPDWPRVYSDIESRIRRLYKTHSGIKERTDVLAKRFKYHVQLDHISYEEARDIYSREIMPDWVSNTLHNAACLYSTFHLTLEYTDLIYRAFPSAIRCTVHPKEAAQFPLHLTNKSNSLLPYNGVATIPKNTPMGSTNYFTSLRIKRFCDVLRYSDVTAVFVQGDDFPYYYEIA